ncbi:MAG: M23 family metallopeptidase [Clostridium sp.]|uniref:peptidoglycan DD-metalloendopeptidase family protein n=1 Tax=Clostridium sp. DSM 8431 TaxID=1761781 RepID=UPI0008EB84BF|nr:peptidoglycan DD-metalloendopeptidase family protein [Clostridium sp. DSM 8431]MCR4945016.1 M23 family metallopeptidase [Clostridium sp.]SFU78711.1 Peptidase family M23 [Clostridium sp. DSM 8431]
MDKNYKQIVKDFFRKEGFYIVLFICLCIVAAVGTIVYNNSLDTNSQTDLEVNEDSKEQASLNKDSSEEENNRKEDNNKEIDKGVSTEIPNAERAEAKNNKTNESSKAVAATSEVKFVKPVEGALLRGYTYPKPVKISENEQRTIAGIDVEAKLGTDVKAAAEGVVENVGKGSEQEGICILIKHANGMKTKYCNLDSKTMVKKGDKVTTDTVIGKVGQSVKIFGDDYFKEYLNIQILNANNEQVDPLKYLDYKNKQ